MPRQPLSHDESLRVLAGQGIVRVAFRDGSSTYLIPLGYAYVPPVLCGVADIGRKTRLAELNPVVAFQVDTSGDTGLWEWRSVTGEGTFEIVRDDDQRQAVLEALQPVIQRAPDWWLREQGPHLAAGDLLAWKITPTNIAGREYARPDDSME